ncbi:BPL-N domain-containing protein [Gimesia fumaroli]|uniref:Biotin-protein ligase N-terminal domain-containing protein n=1 Tax=Gimesia fumaroli TaxID=2527976 RepID=A0A518ICU1_9PLAN|nr:BPL-N domain-containing protein [Gimesia fumaroli]QDV50922.1 hypothetical protein Enr17x_29670 [Gimesia fumaroli]
MMNLVRSLLFVLLILGAQVVVRAKPVEYCIHTSAESGPTVAVIGYAAEAEPAGVYAASQIVNWDVSRGSLVVLLQGNERPLIHEQQQSRLGDQSRWANSVQEVLDQVKPDLVIQLSESFDAKSIIHEANGATIFGSGNRPQLQKQLNAMASAAQTAGGAEEPLWKLVLLNESDAAYPTISIVSSSKDPKKRRLWLRTRQQRAAVHSLLFQLKMRPESASADDMMPQQQEKGRIRLAIYQGPGAVSSSGHDPVWIQQSLKTFPEFQTALIGPAEIQSGGLSQFDVLLIGGGLSNRQSKGLGPEGRAAVVQFVKAGGGYVGICAGMFLASSDSDLHLHLLPIDVSGSSGIGKVQLDFEADAELRVKGSHPAKFSGGPVAVRKMNEADESVKILAYFRTEPKDRKSKKKLTDTPAIVCGNHGKGRVFLFSPHCERYPGPRTAFYNALRWAGKSELPKD